MMKEGDGKRKTGMAEFSDGIVVKGRVKTKVSKPFRFAFLVLSSFWGEREGELKAEVVMAK